MTALNINNLENTKTLNEVKSRTQEIIEYFQTKEAKLLAHDLETKLHDKGTKLDKQTISEYQSLVVSLKFVALPLLSEFDIVSLVRNNLADAYKIDIDIIERIKFKLETMPLESRDAFKKKIAQAIDRNEQAFTKGWLYKSDGSKEPPTLENWMKDFRFFMGDNIKDRLKVTEYVSKNELFKQLSKEDQEKVKNVISLYQLLNYSTFSILGYEGSVIIRDKNGRLKVFESGSFETIRPTAEGPAETISPPVSEPTKPEPADSIALLKRQYDQYRRQRQPILAAEDAIVVKTKGDTELVKKELAAASRDKQPQKLIACIKILARQKSLANALANPAWFEAISEYISGKYAQQYDQPSVDQALKNLKNNPATPAAVSEFLQYLLKEKINMTENDSALVGSEVGQILGGAYQGLAYGNPETGNFEWVQNKIVDHKLVSDVD